MIFPKKGKFDGLCKHFLENKNKKFTFWEIFFFFWGIFFSFFGFFFPFVKF